MLFAKPKKYVVIDYVIAQIEGYKPTGGEHVSIKADGHCYIVKKTGHAPCEFRQRLYAPTTEWAQGGPLLIKYRRDIFGGILRPSKCEDEVWQDLTTYDLHDYMRTLANRVGRNLMPTDEWMDREFGPNWRELELL